VRLLEKGVKLGFVQIAKQICLRNNLAVAGGGGRCPFGRLEELLAQCISFSPDFTDRDMTSAAGKKRHSASASPRTLRTDMMSAAGKKRRASAVRKRTVLL
jgi:hypothetical protein